MIRRWKRAAGPCGGLAVALLLASTAQAAINISTQATQNMSCSGGVCTATAQKAYLNVNDVTNMLAAGDLKVISGAGAEDIHIQAPFSWTSLSRLTLDAQRSIEFQKPVTVAGTGALTLITDDGGSGGDYWFDEGASVSFWDTNSSLIINGQSFTLVKDIKTLAADIAANPSGNFALANNYDASVDGTYAASPIPTTLAGQFDGLGNIISQLTIKNLSDQRTRMGLLLQTASTAALRDTILSNALIAAGTEATAGALVAINDGLVIHCSADSRVSLGSDGVGGGLVGASYGVVSNSSSKGKISNDEAEVSQVMLGGLIGENSGEIDDSSSSASVSLNLGGLGGGLVGLSSGPIMYSHATGKVSGKEAAVGGLVGFSLGANAGIFFSFASGPVTANGDSQAGGLVASTNSVIDSSFARGPVQGGGNSWIGGIAGALRRLDSFSHGVLKHSYSLAPVTGANSANLGGAVGYKDRGAEISQVYANGAVGGTARLIGGFLGLDGYRPHHPKITIRAAYWNLDTSGISDPAQGCGNVQNCPGVTGLTDAQLKSGLPEGFDPKVWGLNPNINNGYPYLLANPPPKDNKAIRHHQTGANHAR